jgi:hypothetical protein
MSCNDDTINPHSSQLQENSLWVWNRIVILHPQTHKRVMFTSNLNNHPINSVLNVSTLSTIISETSFDVIWVPNIYSLEQRTPLPTQLSSFRNCGLKLKWLHIRRQAQPYYEWLSVGTNYLNCFTIKCIYGCARACTHKILKSTIFWEIMLCSLAEVHQCFGGMYCLHLHGWTVS